MSFKTENKYKPIKYQTWKKDSNLLPK